MSESVNKRRKKGEGRESDERKKRRNSGLEYTTKNNVVVPAKKPPAQNVTCKCRYSCKYISHPQKLLLFDDFYKAEFCKQKNYLLGLITVKPVKRRRHGQYNDPKHSRRQATAVYTVPNGDGEIVQVCRSTFQEIIGLVPKRVQTLVELKQTGNPMYSEKRGNKTEHRKYTVQDENMVCDHVNSIPREVSHYGRNKTEKEYLSPDLNISRLFIAFKEKYPNAQISKRFYFDTFKKKFPNLSFHRLRTDTCATCDFLQAKISSSLGHEKVQNQNRLKLHHLKAEKARSRLKTDSKNAQGINSNTNVFSLDLQQVFSLPTLSHSNMYYLRQLSTYNLGAHFHNGLSMMTLWHEGQSCRGGNEVASCLLKVLKDVTPTHTLIAWSDNCAGQNKNRMLLFLWIYLAAIGVYKEVHHKFLVAGHTFLDCDRDFAVIEKRKRVTMCYTPEDLKKMIESVREKNPFVVNMMGENDFFNIKECCDKFLNTKKLNISKLIWIKVDASSPGKIKVKKTFNELEQWTTVNVFKPGVTINDIKNIDIPGLECISQISHAKKTDLRSMIPFLAEQRHKQFYEQLTS